ncbi:MAG: VIT1/CCC1 transporter family protein [Parcubacteria group bacterium]
MVKLPVRRSQASYLRNFIFGVEDSLVSTVGLLSGVAIAGVAERTVVLAGVVLIFVEAFSMATGSFLAEYSTAEYVAQRKTSARRPLIDAIIMFFSYFVTGFLPLLPYTFLPIQVAFWSSIGVTLVALFVLGAVAAKVSKIHPFRNGLKALIIGGLAVLLGVVIGQFFSL